MQELLKHWNLSLDEVKANPLSEVVIETARTFEQKGCLTRYAGHYLRRMLLFGIWIKKNHISLSKLSLWHVDIFLGEMGCVQPALKKRDKFFQATARHAVKVTHKLIPPSRTPVEQEIVRYADHLRSNRGLNEGTIKRHVRHLERFFKFFFKRSLAIRRLTPLKIRDYIERIAPEAKNVRNATCGMLRGYFRFLQIQGVDVAHLLSAVPSVPSNRRSLSPLILQPSDLETLLRSVDRSTQKGKRTYASILCLSDLGMRVGDVPRISLDEINWREGTIVVHNHKSDSPFRLPMSQRLGDALVDYIKTARPPSSSRQVFLCCSSYPKGKPVAVRGIWTAIDVQWAIAGLQDKYSGTHVIRHSTATHLKQNGVPLKVIADVLGHQSLHTTTLYAQVDLPALRQVAQPWPGKSEVK